MITADTITDEQIRELRREARLLIADTYSAERNPDVFNDSGMRADVTRERQDARARCAELINERQVGAK